MPKKTTKPPSPEKEASLETTPPERLVELAQQDVKLARVVAKNLSTPPDLLARLAYSQDKLTRQSVVNNPNTPTKTLLELSSQFPVELLDNPIFDLLLLENPNLLRDMPKSSLKSIMKRETLPQCFLNWAVNHGDDDVLVALLRNPQLTQENLIKLTEYKNPQIVDEAKLHINWHEEIENLEEFVCQVLRKNDLKFPQEKQDIVSLFVEMISPQLANNLIVFTSHEVRSHVALNPNTPVALLERLATDEDYNVRSHVASNPNTPVALLERLATDEDYNVRSHVALNPNTPVALLERLATDEDYNVRSHVASNPNTPVNLLEKLATDEDYYIRSHVASNHNTPVALLERLATDKYYDVRSHVALNPNTPVALLERLATDEDYDVRSHVASNPNTPVALLEKLATDEDYYIRSHVASNPNTPVNLLEKLATDEDYYIRLKIASHPKTPSTLLDKLTTDSQYDNWYGTWYNRHNHTHNLYYHNNDWYWGCAEEEDDDIYAGVMIIIEINKLRDLLNDRYNEESEYVEDQLIHLENKIENEDKYSVKQLMNLADKSDSYFFGCLKLSKYRLEELSKHPNPHVRCCIAFNPNTPDSLLEKLASDPINSVRYVVANNTSNQKIHKKIDLFNKYYYTGDIVLPNSVLEKLADDLDKDIRWCVAKSSKTSITLLEKLSHDENSSVRSHVASNPNTPVALLERLANDENYNVRSHVISNPKCNKQCKINVFNTLAKSTRPNLGRLAVFLSPYAEIIHLVKHFPSTSWLERWAIAQNPNTPDQTLRYLANEGNRLVRKAAELNIKQRKKPKEINFIGFSEGWKLFCQWRNKNTGVILPKNLNLSELYRFAARYRLALSYEGIKLKDYTQATIDAYGCLLGVFLAYSALEQLFKAVGLENIKSIVEEWAIQDKSLAEKLRKNDKILNFLHDKVSSSKLKGRIVKFQQGDDDNVLVVAQSMRHLVAHGILTVHSGEVKPKTMIQVCDLLRDSVNNKSEQCCFEYIFNKIPDL